MVKDALMNHKGWLQQTWPPLSAYTRVIRVERGGKEVTKEELATGGEETGLQ